MTYTTIRHRESIWGVELDKGRIVRAVGPFHEQHANLKPVSVETLIENARPGHAEADGTWLQRECEA